MSSWTSQTWLPALILSRSCSGSIVHHHQEAMHLQPVAVPQCSHLLSRWAASEQPSSVCRLKAQAQLSHNVGDRVMTAIGLWCRWNIKILPKCHRSGRWVVHAVGSCWNYKVIRSQRRCLEGLFNDRDDADDEYWLIRDAVDAVYVYIDCLQTLTSQRV